MRSGWMLMGGVFAVLVGLGFVFPAIALLRNQGSLPAFEVVLLTFGAALSVSGLAAITFGIRQLCARSRG